MTPAAFLPPRAGISATGCAVQQIQLQLSLVVRAALGRARPTAQGNHRHTQAVAERRRTAPPCLPRHRAPRSRCRPVALCRALPGAGSSHKPAPHFGAQQRGRVPASLSSRRTKAAGEGRAGCLPARSAHKGCGHGAALGGVQRGNWDGDRGAGPLGQRVGRGQAGMEQAGMERAGSRGTIPILMGSSVSSKVSDSGWKAVGNGGEPQAPWGL